MELDISALDNVEISGAEQAKRKGIVDIVFLLDITGSMGPAIVQLGKNIANFVENIDPEKVSDWRAKIISFGDLEHDSPELSLGVSRPYTSNPQDIVNQIVECVELVKQGGGGDEPESSLDALYIAARDSFDEPWSVRKRAIILFTDATPKAITKETLGVDADGLQLLSQQISDNHVYTYMYAPVHDDYIALKNNTGKYVQYTAINEDGNNPIEALKSLDFPNVMESLAKSISEATIAE